MGRDAVDFTELDPIAQRLFGWCHDQPLVGVLCVLMALDIVSGLVAAFAMKRVCSTASWRGMCRKALVALVVGAAFAIDHVSPVVPVAKIVCLFYCITEALSILENAARAGVPLPKVMVDALWKLRSEVDGQPAGMPAQQSVNIHEASLVNVQPPGGAMVAGDPIAGPRGDRGEKGERGPQGVPGRN